MKSWAGKSWAGKSWARKSWAGKSWAGSALGALILMTAAPALAGGYWDAGGPPVGPPAATAPCRLGDHPCPPPPCLDARAGSRREGARDDRERGHEVVVPAEFFETGGVGPDFIYDDEGGGGGVVESEAFASAGAFASASASASVDVSLRERERFGHKRHMMPPHQPMPYQRPPQRHMTTHGSGGHGRW